MLVRLNRDLPEISGKPNFDPLPHDISGHATVRSIICTAFAVKKMRTRVKIGTLLTSASRKKNNIILRLIIYKRRKLFKACITS